MLNIESIVVGAFEVNCFVIWGGVPRAIVIDPGADSARILDFLAGHSLTVAAILLTHGHVDHLSALSAVHQANPAPLGLHADDDAWAFGPDNRLPPFYEAPDRPAAVARPFRGEASYTDGTLAYDVLPTPGHTPGSVCFHFPREKVLISGDTLFQGSVGRTDLPGGDPRLLQLSLRRLALLPDDTRVYPGHGPATTIADEKRTNYFMQSACHHDRP